MRPEWNEVIKRYEQTSSIIAKRVRYNLKYRQKNFLPCFVGDTGSGKSYADLDFSLSIDPTFFIIPDMKSYDRLIFGEMADIFMRNLNRTNFLQTGHAFMWDELGRGLPKKEWYDIINRSINKVIQSFRWRRIALTMTVPDKSYIDSDTVKLFHMVFEMTKIDFKKNVSIAKPKEVQVNRISGKAYYKYPRVKDKWGRIYEMRKIKFRLPPDIVTEAFEKKKQRWLKVADKYLEMEIKSTQSRRMRDKIDIGVIINEMLDGQNWKSFVRKDRYEKTIIEEGEICRIYNVGSKTAKSIRAGVEFNLRKMGKI